MKHSLSLILVLTALLTASLTGCSDTSDNAIDTAPVTTGTADVETETADTATYSRDVLPEADFGGAAYHIMGREYAKLGDLPSYEFTTDSENGDLINDTVYKRCAIVEEQYNIDITCETYATDKSAAALETSQLAGDCAFDLVWSHIGSMGTMVQKSLLSNYYDIPHIDITSPWWNQLATESLTVNGRCYLQMNYIPFTGVMLSHCLYYNKALAAQYDISGLYEHVLDNTWTFDVFAETVKTVSSDVNGDGIYDSEDLFGLLGSHGTVGVAMGVAMDVKPLEIANDGTFSLTMATDRNQSLFDRIADLIETDAVYMITDYALENDLARMFAADKGLFYSGFLTDSYQFFRDMESDFGLLPFPKADDTQEHYITTITGGTGLLGIPLVLSDAEKTGLITEALAIESYRLVYPAIYETVFEDKVLRDEESSQMFDILMQGMEIDFGRTFKRAEYVDLFGELLVKGQRTLISSAEKQEKATEKHFQKIIDLYFTEE